MDFTPPDSFLVWTACGYFAFLFANAAIKFKRSIAGQPPNEALGANASALEQRVAKTEKEISEIWNTFRDENVQIRREMSEAVKQIERGLGRVEGAIEEWKKERRNS